MDAGLYLPGDVLTLQQALQILAEQAILAGVSAWAVGADPN